MQNLELRPNADFAAAISGQNFSEMTQHKGHATEVDIARVNREVESQVIMAKKFPRNEAAAYNSLMQTCSREKFAATATYSYPKGGQKVEGPSIRLAEAAARAWGNMQFGVREINRIGGRSIAESFAWDLETNVRSSIEFTVAHVRDTKKGPQELTSERDIYELIANFGARRLRKCILELIPEDVISDALVICDKAMHQSLGKGDIKEKIRGMTEKFKEFGVHPEHLEKRLGNKLSACTVNQLMNLGKIYLSLQDGMSEASDWFDLEIKATVVDKKAEVEKENEAEKEDALKKLMALSQKAQGKFDPKVYDTIMQKIDLSTLKGIKAGIDILTTKLGDLH